MNTLFDMAVDAGTEPHTSLDIPSMDLLSAAIVADARRRAELNASVRDFLGTDAMFFNDGFHFVGAPPPITDMIGASLLNPPIPDPDWAMPAPPPPGPVSFDDVMTPDNIDPGLSPLSGPFAAPPPVDDGLGVDEMLRGIVKRF